jgi:hypothetical protein
LVKAGRLEDWVSFAAQGMERSAMGTMASAAVGILGKLVLLVDAVKSSEVRVKILGIVALNVDVDVMAVCTRVVRLVLLLKVKVCVEVVVLILTAGVTTTAVDVTSVEVSALGEMELGLTVNIWVVVKGIPVFPPFAVFAGEEALSCEGVMIAEEVLARVVVVGRLVGLPGCGWLLMVFPDVTVVVSVDVVV